MSEEECNFLCMLADQENHLHLNIENFVINKEETQNQEYLNHCCTQIRNLTKFWPSSAFNFLQNGLM